MYKAKFPNKQEWDDFNDNIMEMAEKNKNNVEPLKKNATNVGPISGIKISKLFKNPIENMKVLIQKYMVHSIYGIIPFLVQGYKYYHHMEN